MNPTGVIGLGDKEVGCSGGEIGNCRCGNVVNVNGIGIAAFGSAVENQVSGDIWFGVRVPSQVDAAGGRCDLMAEEKKKRGKGREKRALHRKNSQYGFYKHALCLDRCTLADRDLEAARRTPDFS